MDNGDAPAMPCDIAKVIDPLGRDCGPEHQSKGLTKREYLSGMAMQGICSVGRDEDLTEICLQENISPKNAIARAAVSYADALLAELEKDNG